MSEKIAIILHSHTGATFPLIYHLLKKGYEVDLFFNCDTGKTIKVEGLEVAPISYNGVFHEIFRSDAPAIFSYFSFGKFRMFLFRFPRPFDHVKLLHFLTYPRLYVSYIRFVNFVNKRHYKWINIITRYEISYNSFIIKKLNPCPTVSLHEVCDHYEAYHKNEKSIPQIYDTIRKRDCKVILYSDNTLNEISQYGLKPQNLFRCNFGFFETYKTSVMDFIMELPQKYILFIGIISEYKGLDLLYEAVNLIPELKDYKFVIAGKGYVPALDNMKNDERFILINRFLLNNEFTELIQRSSFLICPYKTMSQSGIPQTSFLFNKPIVASDLEGFREIIFDGENGLLFSVGSSKSLAEAIKNMIANINMYQTNVKNFLTFHPEYSWDYIVAQYDKQIRS